LGKGLEGWGTNSSKDFNRKTFTILRAGGIDIRWLKVYNSRVMESAGGNLSVIISRAEIETRLVAMAAEIRREYADRRPVLLVVLKGAFIFAADLMRRLNIPLEVDFLRVSSYGDGTESSGDVSLEYGQGFSLSGRHVLLIEDIVDTGLTLEAVCAVLSREEPASLRVCALLDKPARRRVAVQADYLGFSVPDEFIVGYGLDYGGDYRYLADICVLGEKDE
jgi:hypoxanthine phosphoribosyltransferase